MNKPLLGIIALVAVVFIGWFLSYRLLEVPDGITADEAAFGLNGALLANTLHDENDRLLPVFVLSLSGKDWRQPITQYSAAVMFKLFGASLYNLRLVSVLFGIASILLFFFLLKNLFTFQAAFIGSLLLLVTPIFFMHTHLGLDNIAPLPFVLVWLIGVVQYSKTQDKKYLMLSAVALGLSIYSYKAMRLFVPVWGLTTVLYLWSLGDWKFRRNSILPGIIFALVLIPFFIIMPLLELKYAGALMGGASASFDSPYAFLYPYFATFDLSFLFIKGDLLAFHSTGHHGMLLLATLPLFVIGVVCALRKNTIWWFLLTCLVIGPALFGLVGSVHRASRLLALLPFFLIFTTLGLTTLWQSKQLLQKGLVVVIGIFLVANAADFLQHYWFTYPKQTQNIFGGHYHDSYVVFGEEAKKRNLVPYIEEDIIRSDADGGRFFSLAYIPQPVNSLKSGEELPKNGILLSTSAQKGSLKNIGVTLPTYFIHTY